MIERRDLLCGAAFGAALVSSQAVAACSLAEFEDDDWGRRLIEYLRTGNESRLDGLFHAFCTFVAFDTSLVDSDALHFQGQRPVRGALVGFRKKMTEKGWTEPRKLVEANIVGSSQQGRMSKIELVFAESKMSDTSCGPDRSELRADLYYQAGVYETAEDSVKWAVERLAVMPPLELEKFNG